MLSKLKVGILRRFSYNMGSLFLVHPKEAVFTTLHRSMQNLLFTAVSPGGTPYNGLYEEASPERGTFFRLQVYKRVGISQV